MNTLNRVAIRAVLCAVLSYAAGSALAQPPQDQPPSDQPPSDQPGGRHHHGPPPEALAACKSASSGQECSFISPHGDQISGTCMAHEEGKPLACRPAHPPSANQ